MQKISPVVPLLVFSTRTGTPYNLTPANQPKLKAIQLSAGDFMHMKPVLKALPQHLSFKKFIGCAEDVLTYLTPYDYNVQHGMNGCKGEKIKIMCRNGYQEVSWYEYYELVELIRPDFWVGLTEVPSLFKEHKDESSNSLKRAIGKTNAFLRSLPKEGVVPGLVLPIHGGHNIKLLEKSLEEVLQYGQAVGVVICDVCEAETLEQRENVYRLVKAAIDKKSAESGKQYMICLAGQGKIEDVIHASKFGVTCFEIGYPFALAEKQKALVYQQQQFLVKEPELHPNLDPLQKQCECTACSKYSEAYIAHLIKCHQMAAKVLLSIHNSAQYLRYFS